MSIFIIGKIKLKEGVQTFDSGFSKRDFVIDTSEQYSQSIKFELYKDKCALLDSFNIGDDVQVSYNLRGNEYNGKYYVQLQAWKIEALKSNKEHEEGMSPNKVLSTNDDDLPF